MPRISTEKRQDRRNSILVAARRMFVENGSESSSIIQIARYADVSEGLIYRYFENKHDLLCQVIAATYSDFVTRIEAIIASDVGFDERLRRLIHFHLLNCVEEPDICRLLITEVNSSNDNLHSDLVALDKRYSLALMRFVQNGIRESEIRKEINPRLARDMLWGVLEHVVRRHLNGRMPIKVDVACSEIVDLLLGGLKIRVAESPRADLLLGGLKTRGAAAPRTKTNASHPRRVARAGNGMSA